MLRVSGTERPGHFRLAGRLAEEEVDRLASLIERTHLSGTHVTLDLDELTFADQRGQSLLKRLAGEGAALVGGSPFIRMLVWGE